MLTDNIFELISETPLLQLKGEKIFAKAVFFNAGGSIKTSASSIKKKWAEARRKGEEVKKPQPVALYFFIRTTLIKSSPWKKQ